MHSHRPEVREQIRSAIGRRPAADIGRIDFLDATGVAEVLMAVDSGGVDVVVLDGEAQPTGGIGISRQIHQEAGRRGAPIPPVILVVKRADDRWLATWAQASEVLVHPLDPVTAAETVAHVLRRVLHGDLAGTPGRP
ncbi:hypothetical protein JL107_06455 [Nakamurella flavida]|uniref:Response regulatory domain-containing protein n=1 Tax=Nakamurella flavida TaxID=363630 RepID=A0A938YJ51_9ACTN|nr:hypothetical protein [Nakamurella flavida]